MSSLEKEEEELTFRDVELGLQMQSKSEGVVNAELIDDLSEKCPYLCGSSSLKESHHDGDVYVNIKLLHSELQKLGSLLQAGNDSEKIKVRYSMRLNWLEAVMDKCMEIAQEYDILVGSLQKLGGLLQAEKGSERIRLRHIADLKWLDAVKKQCMNIGKGFDIMVSKQARDRVQTGCARFDASEILPDIYSVSVCSAESDTRRAEVPLDDLRSRCEGNCKILKQVGSNAHCGSGEANASTTAVVKFGDRMTSDTIETDTGYESKTSDCHTSYQGQVVITECDSAQCDARGSLSSVSDLDRDTIETHAEVRAQHRKKILNEDSCGTDSDQCHSSKICKDSEQTWKAKQRGAVIELTSEQLQKSQQKQASKEGGLLWREGTKKVAVDEMNSTAEHMSPEKKKQTDVRAESSGACCVLEGCGQRIKDGHISHYKEHLYTKRHRDLSIEQFNECVKKFKETVALLPASEKRNRLRPKGSYCVVGTCEMSVQYDIYTYRRHLRRRHKNLSAMECNDAVNKFRKTFSKLLGGGDREELKDLQERGESSLQAAPVGQVENKICIQDSGDTYNDVYMCPMEKACTVPGQTWNSKEIGGVAASNTKVAQKSEHKQARIEAGLLWREGTKEVGITEINAVAAQKKKQNGVTIASHGAYCVVENCGQRIKNGDISHYKQHLKTQRHRDLSIQQFNDCVVKFTESVSLLPASEKRSRIRPKGSYCVFDTCEMPIQYDRFTYKQHLRRMHKGLSVKECNDALDKFQQMFSKLLGCKVRDECKDPEEACESSLQAAPAVNVKKKISDQDSTGIDSHPCPSKKACKDPEQTWNSMETGGVVEVNHQLACKSSQKKQQKGVRIKRITAHCVVESCGKCINYYDISHYKQHLKTKRHRDLTAQQFNDCVDKFREIMSQLPAPEKRSKIRPKGAKCVVDTCEVRMQYDIYVYKRHLRRYHTNLSAKECSDAVDTFRHMFSKLLRGEVGDELKCSIVLSK